MSDEHLEIQEAKILLNMINKDCILSEDVFLVSIALELIGQLWKLNHETPDEFWRNWYKGISEGTLEAVIASYTNEADMFCMPEIVFDCDGEVDYTIRRGKAIECAALVITANMLSKNKNPIELAGFSNLSGIIRSWNDWLIQHKRIDH